MLLEDKLLPFLESSNEQQAKTHYNPTIYGGVGYKKYFDIKEEKTILVNDLYGEKHNCGPEILKFYTVFNAIYSNEFYKCDDFKRTE